LTLIKPIQHILLADDDEDDQMLFRSALESFSSSIQLSTASNGEQLMIQLKKASDPLPDVLFLDLNMPCKNGIECLKEIKNDPKLVILPIFIFSTSAQEESIDLTYETGANYYIQKPSGFGKLKEAIAWSLSMNSYIQPIKENFVVKF